MVFEPFALWKWLSIIHSGNYPSQLLPTDSASEALFDCEVGYDGMPWILLRGGFVALENPRLIRPFNHSCAASERIVSLRPKKVSIGRLGIVFGPGHVSHTKTNGPRKDQDSRYRTETFCRRGKRVTPAGPLPGHAVNRLPGSAGILPASLQKGPTPAGRDAGAPRFMVPIHVHSWKTFLPMNRLHFPIRGRRTSATDEDDLKDPIAALSPSSSSFVLRPSSVDGDEQHTDLCAGTHGARFMVTIHVHSLENFPTHEPAERAPSMARTVIQSCLQAERCSALRFMVPMRDGQIVEATHEPTPFPNSRTKNERDGRGRFEGPHCGAFALVLVLRPSSFVRRWRRTAHRPTCRDARSAVHGHNSCPFFGKLSCP